MPRRDASAAIGASIRAKYGAPGIVAGEHDIA
jgi:hypothetical protein